MNILVSAQELPTNRKEWSSNLTSTTFFEEMTSKKNFKIPDFPIGLRHDTK